jgi:hypothetical protein
MKSFFSIKETKYRFEISDLMALITIFNVTLIVMGVWWASLLGILNCIIAIVVGVQNSVHINYYITQLALIILNIYFLTL